METLSLSQLRQKPCTKWQMHPDDVLPLWVADMDFPIADPVQDALAAHLKTENFGYPPREGLPGLKEAATERLQNRYGWRLEPRQLHLINGIVAGLNLGVLALTSPGDEVLMLSPIYGPFRMAVEHHKRTPVYSQLVRGDTRYEIDFDDLEAKISPATRLLMLCNPHNPVGRVFTRDALERLANLALKHRLWVVSDELHADLTFKGHRHIPFASLGPEISARTLTLYGPTKAFNLAGLKIGFAMSENEALLERFQNAGFGLVGGPNVLAQAATIAAFRQGDAWLEEILDYIGANRDAASSFVAKELPRVRHSPPEGTYLSWFDLSAYGIEDPPSFVLEEAKVALNDGSWFGPGGEGHLRLNLATSREILDMALERIKDALTKWQLQAA